MSSTGCWSLSRGTSVLPDGSVRFSVWAPRAHTVAVSIGNTTGSRSHVLASMGEGLYETVVDGLGAGMDYYYRLDAGPLRPDPVSRHRPAGVHGPSRIVDPTAYQWSDGDWRGLAMADLVVYELHVGTFTAEGSFDSAIDRLSYLRSLGVTALELMPVAEFPGGRNWGYDGVSLYSPQSSYGGPEGLRRLVDACHAEGLGVILDVVYNHTGPEGNYLPEFGPYSSRQHRTPWGPAWNLDGPGSAEVRRYLVENALYWITEFHLDGFRIDAADKIVDQSPLHILAEIAGAVGNQALALGRRVTLIAESDAADLRLLNAAEEGGCGLDAQWMDDFHHAVHVCLTGERHGRLAKYGGVAPVARALARPLGVRAEELPGNRVVVCIQNHDQVGNRAWGERLATLVIPDALRLAAAVLLLSPYIPLLFMGEEYGERNPFLYFVSHSERELVAVVREGRRRELCAEHWTGDLPDPLAEATFARSCLDWSCLGEPGHAALRTLYGDLLQLRRTEPALRPGVARVGVQHDVAEEWVRVDLTASGSKLSALFNFANTDRTLQVPDRPELLLSTDGRRYGGRDRMRIARDMILLPPLSAAAFRPTTP